MVNPKGKSLGWILGKDSGEGSGLGIGSGDES